MDSVARLPARTFLRFAAVCACLYLAAQLFQWGVLTFWTAPPETPEAAILSRLLVPQRARSVAVLLSFPAWLVAFSGVALCTVRRAPAAAALGMLFASLFVTLELAYRSIDVFVVTGGWARALHEAADQPLRTIIVERVALWRQAVVALYFPLLIAHAAASAAFAVGVWTTAGDRLSRALAALLALNAVQALGRVAEMHLGVQALGAINTGAYFPTTFALLGAMAAWLWRQGDRGRDV